MKIALVSASLSRQAGGLFDSMCGIGEALAQRAGHEVTALGFHDEDFPRDRDKWGRVKARTFSVKGPGSFGYAPDLTAALLSGEFDLVHTHGLWVYTSIAVRTWHRKTGKPYVISPHGMLDPWALKNAGWKKKIAAAFYESAHLKSAACLHALCRSEAESIRNFGLHQPMAIIPNGVSFPSLADSPSPVRSHDRTLLYLGRLHPKKNLKNLLSAWSKIKNSRWKLKIAGWDQVHHESELKALAAELGLQDRVLFVGPQFNQDRVSCYRGCDAFILPSLSEGLPMTILEAWSFGKPVLMTDACNLPEGFAAQAALVTGSSVESIHDTLQLFLEKSSQDQAAMGMAGRSLVEKKFQWPKIGDEFEALYQWLLHQAPQPQTIVPSGLV